MSKRTHNFRPGHIAVGKMIAALIRSPQTVADLCEVSGLDRVTVRGYMRAFKRERAIFVADWEFDKSGRMSLRAYKLGFQSDRPRPRMALDAAQRQRERRTRLKQAAMHQMMCGQLAD